MRTSLASRHVGDALEQPKRSALLSDVDECAPPQPAGDAVAVRTDDLGYVGIIVSGSQFDLEIQDDLCLRSLRGQGPLEAGAQIVTVSVVELEVADLASSDNADDAREAASLSVGVGGRAKHIIVLFGRRQLNGFGNADHQNDLLRPSHFGQGQSDG